MILKDNDYRHHVIADPTRAYEVARWLAWPT